MSHNRKKLFWPLLLLVLSLSGGLMLAFGPGTVMQRDFNRSHDLTVEMISVGPNGFQSTSLTRPAGRFLLGINNRSGLKELTFQVTREDGRLMQEARINPKQPNWRSLMNLPVGTYQLTETSHADWVCSIVITPHR